MPKQNRVSIYEYLFKEGVMVAKKDYHAPKHPDLEKIPNLQVIKAMQSLKSRGYVKEQFAWRHFYWYILAILMMKNNVYNNSCVLTLSYYFYNKTSVNTSHKSQSIDF